MRKLNRTEQKQKTSEHIADSKVMCISFVNFLGLLIVSFCVLLIIWGYVVKCISYHKLCSKTFESHCPKEILNTQLQECLNSIAYNKKKLKTAQLSNKSNMIN